MKKLNRLFNKLLAGSIALLGFSGCSTDDDPFDPNGMVCMYGTPHGTYEVTGVVCNEDGEKLDDMRVVTSLRDTVYTKDGAYTIGPKGEAAFTSIEVKAEDPAGIYTDETQKVTLVYKGGDKGWNVGDAKATADFRLSKAE